jgi:hypothetical protein
MTNTTADITVSRTHHTTTYENNELGVILASVRYNHGHWHSYCFYSDEEYDEAAWSRRATAETIARRHAHDMTDAL